MRSLQNCMPTSASIKSFTFLFDALQRRTHHLHRAPDVLVYARPLPRDARHFALARRCQRRGTERWLSEDEFFYLQATLMADFEDDCPYQGTLSKPYSAHVQRHERPAGLRGYFTWRTQVRAGNVEETSLSFAFVYLYELLCGIGCADAQDGFRAIKSFWETYRTFAPETRSATSASGWQTMLSITTCQHRFWKTAVPSSSTL